MSFNYRQSGIIPDHEIEKECVLTQRGQSGQLHKPSVLEELLKQTCLRQSTLFVLHHLVYNGIAHHPMCEHIPDADMLEF
jgi:hypothetical protein